MAKKSKGKKAKKSKPSSRRVNKKNFFKAFGVPGDG